MSSLPDLPLPVELLEMIDQEVREFTVVKAVVGNIVIKPRFPGAPATKTVRTVRISVTREEKPIGVDYWDLTAGNLVAQVEPLVTGPGPFPRKMRLKKFGIGPTSRFMVTSLAR